MPSDFYARATHPERCVVGHPFNPVYLLPLVEVLGGERTSPEAVEAAMTIYRTLGMRPLHVRKEVPGFIADRLLEALWREALHLVDEGVATTGEIDDAIRFGAGIRWSFHGHVPDLHVGGRRRGHATLHAAVRPRARTAVDEAGRAATDRCADRPRRRRHPRTAGHAQHQGARALIATSASPRCSTRSRR
nr:3-hydroxyacyl-CoA dehydrogenase NAD-binding domain-containing protein [Burkholderia vietnamiensis]